MASIAFKIRQNSSKVNEKQAEEVLHVQDYDGITEKDDTERKLEKFLFGDEAGFLDSLLTKRYSGQIAHRGSGSEESEAEEEDLEEVADEDLFFLDSGDGALPSAYARSGAAADPQTNRPLAWHDSDDDRITISLASNTRLRKLRDTEADDIVTGGEYIRRLRRQYERLHPRPDWAKGSRKRRRISRSDSEDSDISIDDESVPSMQPLGELLRAGGPLTRVAPGLRKRRLRPEVIDIQRTSDIAKSSPSSIDVLQFHPEMPLLLAGGPSSTITLYHISPQAPNPNPVLTSMHLKGSPVHSAEFASSDDTQIFIGSRRRYFHTWSLSSGTVSKVSRPMYGNSRKQQKTMESFKLSLDGKYMGLVGSTKKGGGCINVLSTESAQWVCQCRIDSRGGVADFAWTSEGFMVVGKNGEVNEFDMNTRRVVARWQDEGAIGTTVIATGGSRWVAVGSSSGIVNLYDRLEMQGDRPKPAKVFRSVEDADITSDVCRRRADDGYVFEVEEGCAKTCSSSEPFGLQKLADRQDSPRTGFKCCFVL